jgi:hypothetical protein
MIATSLFVLALAASAPSAQPAAAQPGALREVVYNVSSSLQQSTSRTAYQGRSTQNTSQTDSGTVTVDITGVDGNALLVKVTEVMKQKGGEQTFNGAVTPDGLVAFDAGSIDDSTRELLQYFGTQFYPADKNAVGDTWTNKYDRNGENVQTTYTITKVDGDELTLRENQTGKFSASSATMTTNGTVVVKPGILVPISGDVHRNLLTTDVSGEVRQEFSIHFERKSDTREAAK